VKARTSQALIYWIQLGTEKRSSFTSAWHDYKANDREYKDLRRRSRVRRPDRADRQIDDLERLSAASSRSCGSSTPWLHASTPRATGVAQVQVQARKGGAKLRAREGYFDNP
jgi:hypothetical protein